MKNRGITLITLVITIIVLLILSAVTIATLTGDEGILKQTENAKNLTDIGNEREIVVLSSIQSISKTQGTIEKTSLEEALEQNAGEGKTELIEDGENFVVRFKETDRYYEVYANGEVKGPIEKVTDEYAGDITKGGSCDGSEEKPYQITCIEDLVAFSIATNEGNTDLGISSKRFEHQYVVLTRTLDFKEELNFDVEEKNLFYIKRINKKR